LDQTSINESQTGTSPSGSSITPTQANELVICGVVSTANSNPASSIDGGFSIIDDSVSAVGGQYQGATAAYLIQTSAAAAAPTWTFSSSDGYGVKMASFKVS
jgi:hypothetical protein